MKTPNPTTLNQTAAPQGAITPVPTAIPAFIGYTPQAVYLGQPCNGLPVKVASFAEFESIFGPPQPGYPQYYLGPVSDAAATADSLNFNGHNYQLLPDPATVYYLYNSVRLFYENGGDAAYIVSMGGYGPPSAGGPEGLSLINPNVQLYDLVRGLGALMTAQDATMYICPDATSLSLADNAGLMQAMLLQCSQMQTAISIFDIIGAKYPDPVLYTNDITTFRAGTGETGLSFGAAYYPFVDSSILQSGDINYTNLFGGDVSRLAPLLSPPEYPDPATAAVLAAIENPPSPPLPVADYNNQLLAASNTYTLIMYAVLADANLLPAGGAMAGIMTYVDYNNGVWQAPANVQVADAVSLPINLTDTQQSFLNVDAVTGKSVNAIRSFAGKGILVWGARTLDGSSNDWRYIPVRRTIIMIEQSCKAALQAYVFAPNDATTWSAVVSAINSFLTGLWQQGGLQGASPSSAFNVSCGLGSTMTVNDILNNIMKVSIMVAVLHPAEFLTIVLEQQMAGE
jgi:hypothetical protein